MQLPSKFEMVNTCMSVNQKITFSKIVWDRSDNSILGTSMK